MPQLDRVDQLPLPNLNLYAGLSCVGLFYAVVYALTSAQGSFLSMLSSDVWCTAAVLNTVCCCFFLFTRFLYSLIFGQLHNLEHQHMRDKFWNFVFYKFIFVFGVMNVQEIPEMLCWCVWFAVLGTLFLTEQLCKDRFQFLSFSPNTPTSSHAKIILLLSFILLSCAGLFMVCAVVGWQYGFNHFTFLYSEVFILFAKTLHSIIKHIIHLWDMHHDGVWENRSTYTYYTELVLEVAVLCVDFMHHVHMLLWANMFLSVASLILLMKLRFLYQEIQRRLKRHHNFILVNNTLENRFVRVPSHELMMSEETCAICWEKMRTACRLPCGHIFHMGCLRSWLEHDTVCPTCRISLREDLRQGGQAHHSEQPRPEEEPRERGRGRRIRRNMHNARNWLLRFNGASIASWLPTFSLELHQEDDSRWISDAAELHVVAQQIHSMFPHVPLQAITLDLADTHSVSLTVDRILSDSIYIPEGGGADAQLEGEATPPPQPASAGTENDETATSNTVPRQSQEALNSYAQSSSTSLSESASVQEETYQNEASQSHNAQFSHLTDESQASHDSHMTESKTSHDQDENIESMYSEVESTEQDTLFPSQATEPGLRRRHNPNIGGSGSHDLASEMEQASTPEEDGMLQDPPTGPGQADYDGTESIHAARAISAERSSTGASASDSDFSSTSVSYSRLFSSLQERKAELLRKARRNYLQKESAEEMM